jgi:ACR3 family arsenite transporter
MTVQCAIAVVRKLGLTVLSFCSFFAVAFFTIYFVGSRLGFCYCDAVSAAFNSTGRDFEIAIAIAITAFSPVVALATVVGPLIEVPVMLTLVWAATRLEKRLFGTETVRAAMVTAQSGRA